MGIEYYFARIPADDLSELRQLQTREAIDLVLGRTDMEVSFSPSDEEKTLNDVRHIGMERDFWLLLRDVVAFPKEAPSLWTQHENDTPEPGTTIGDVWMGYSPLFFLVPEQVRQSTELLAQLTHAALSERCAGEFARYDDMDEDEKQSLCQTILECFDDLSRLFNQAVANDEALVWYIS